MRSLRQLSARFGADRSWLDRPRGGTAGGGRLAYLRALRVEPLEARCLLSIGTADDSSASLKYDHIYFDSTTGTPYVPSLSANGVAQSLVPAGSASPVGYTPAQIRGAYGIDSISLGATVGTGVGQTIAIIDAYDDSAFVSSTDPNFVNSDLHKFDLAVRTARPPQLPKAR